MDEDTGPIDKSREFLQIQSGAVHQFTEEYGSAVRRDQSLDGDAHSQDIVFIIRERGDKTVNPVAQRTVIELIILKRQF